MQTDWHLLADKVLEGICKEAGCEQVYFAQAGAVALVLKNGLGELYLEHRDNSPEILISLGVVDLTRHPHRSAVLLEMLRLSWSLTDVPASFFAYDKEKHLGRICRTLPLGWPDYDYIAEVKRFLLRAAEWKPILMNWEPAHKEDPLHHLQIQGAVRG